jgi:hypothetical protein
MTFSFSAIEYDEQEIERLVALLRLWGITYLNGGDDTLLSGEQHVMNTTTGVSLIEKLARCEDARVRDACISLLLLHPELASAALEVLQHSEPEVVARVTILVLATLYLQRFWSARLVLVLGHAPRFPETPFQELWQKHHLPPPACSFGMQGLLALQQLEQRRVGFSIAVTGDWQNQVQHLFSQEEEKHQPVQERIFPIVEGHEHVCEESPMSMRPNVDKADIERFLRTLGQLYRKPGRLYIAGGAALVHAGISARRTLDIDVDVSDGDMLLVIDQLKQRLHLNIEIASPKDFMPVSSQWEALSQYVSRYGSVDVFYFDFYSIALSKIDRATTRDLQDVQLLVQHHIIDLATFDDAFHDVMQQVQTAQGRMRYPRFDPVAFAARYSAIRQQLQP